MVDYFISVTIYMPVSAHRYTYKENSFRKLVNHFLNMIEHNRQRQIEHIKMRQVGECVEKWRDSTTFKTAYFRLGEVKIGYVRLGQVRLGYVALSQVKLDQVSFGFIRLGQAIRLPKIRGFEYGQICLDITSHS